MFPFRIAETRCHGLSRIEGRALRHYEFVIRDTRVELIFIDPASGMLARYETRPRAGSGVSSAISYRYDSGIIIESPVVDLEKRRATSMQRVREASARSDPACRRDVMEMIRRGASAAFEYDIRGSFWVGLREIRGRFVPPRSFYRYFEGEPYHGGGTEIINIDGDAWTKWPGDTWRPASVYERSFDQFVPDGSRIGEVHCLGLTTAEAFSFLVYEYDQYVDTGNALERDGPRRVFVNPSTGLPSHIEHTTRIGRQIEIRRYHPVPAIERPSVPQPQAPVDVPFSEFRRRLSLD